MFISCESLADAAFFHETKADAIHERISFPRALFDELFSGREQKLIRIDRQKSGAALDVIQK